MSKSKLTGKGGKSKVKKKSWTKIKVKEKLNNAVYLESAQYETMLKNVPKTLMITRAILCEKYKVGGSIARALIQDLAKKNLIIPVGQRHASFDLYKGSLAKSALEKAADDAAEEEKKKKKK